MGIAQLQQVINSNGGSVDGHMLTVLKGSTIENIPVRILAVTGGMAAGPGELAALILFEAQRADMKTSGASLPA